MMFMFNKLRKFLISIIENIVYFFSRLFAFLPDISLHSKSTNLNTQNQEPYYKTFITSLSYPFEEHYITTDDGYVLSLWRIPPKIKGSRPIILQHSLLDGAWTWFALQDKKCLPFLLSNIGYDVWLPNSRGNIFSLGHVDQKFDSQQMFNKYWNFSFDEMAKYDVPAVINYIKEISQSTEKIDYIGHSQGASIFMLAYILYPQFMENSIRKFCSLAMVANLKHSSSKFLSFFASFRIFNELSFGNFLNPGVKNGIYFYWITKYFNKIVSFIISSIIQKTPTGRIDYNKIISVMHYEPGGTSYKNIIHWLQCYSHKDIYMYDYGKKKNLKIYNSEMPPKYNKEVLKQWTFETLNFESQGDPYSTQQDVEEFCELIRTKDKNKIKKLNVGNYNNLDYLWSHDAKKDIYDHILRFLEM